MRLIYIVGPYRAEDTVGISRNIRHAREAAKRLWALGYAVICPHSNTAHFDGVVSDRAFIDGGLEMLTRCDAVYMLKGFWNSSGSLEELELAKELELDIIYE